MRWTLCKLRPVRPRRRACYFNICFLYSEGLIPQNRFIYIFNWLYWYAWSNNKKDQPLIVISCWNSMVWVWIKYFADFICWMNIKHWMHCTGWVNMLNRYRLMCRYLLLSHSTGVDMNYPSIQKTQLKSNKDHGNASSGKLGAQHQLGVIGGSLLVKFFSCLYLIL